VAALAKERERERKKKERAPQKKGEEEEEEARKALRSDLSGRCFLNEIIHGTLKMMVL
jgi:hypothetical protein